MMLKILLSGGRDSRSPTTRESANRFFGIMDML